MIPILVNGDGLGTIRIVSHHEDLMFNSQDVATMMSLAALCEAALGCTARKSRISRERAASSISRVHEKAEESTRIPANEQTKSA